MTSSGDVSVILSDELDSQVERIIGARPDVGEIIEAAGHSLESLIRALPGEELVELLQSVRDDVAAQRFDQKSFQLSELHRLASARIGYDPEFRDYRGQLAEHLNAIAQYIGQMSDERSTRADVDTIDASNIEDQQRKRRRRQQIVVSMAAGIAVALASVLGIVTAPSPEPCDEAGSAVADVWNSQRKSKILHAFVSTGLPYAAASFSALERGIDRYADQLVREMVATCEATQVHDAKSGEHLKLRMLCLTNRQRRLSALIEQLEHADASVVERAHTLAAELPERAVCEQPQTLLHGMRPPAPGLASQVDEIRDRLAQARVQELRDNSDEALRIAREQLASAEALSYGPVQAEALYEAGRVLVYRGTPREREEGESMLVLAANLAESERHDELVAEIWNFLVLSACRNHSSTDQARQWNARADSAIQRIGDPPHHRAAALRNLGCIYFEDGELAEAEDEVTKALAILESAPGVSPLDRAAYQHDLGVIVQRRGSYEEALELYERAFALYARELGKTHPDLANLQFDIATLRMRRGDFALARQLLEYLLRVHGEAPGTSYILVGHTYLTLAEISQREGALARAHEHAMKALGIYERAYGAGHARLADAYAHLGTIELWRGAPQKALTAYAAALAIATKHLRQTHISLGYYQLNIAEARLAVGEYDEALVELDYAEGILQPILVENPSLEPFLASVRGRAQLGKGEFDAAVATLESAVQGLNAFSGDVIPVQRADASWALVQALSKIGRANDSRALALARDTLAIYVQQGPEMYTPQDAVKRWLARHGGRGDRTAGDPEGRRAP